MGNKENDEKILQNNRMKMASKRQSWHGQK